MLLTLLCFPVTFFFAYLWLLHDRVLIDDQSVDQKPAVAEKLQQMQTMLGALSKSGSLMGRETKMTRRKALLRTRKVKKGSQ